MNATRRVEMNKVGNRESLEGTVHDSTLEKDMPIYKSGMTAPAFIQALHETDYVSFVAEPFAGRPFGCNGIGRLKDVALVYPDETMAVMNHPHVQNDAEFFSNLFGLPGPPPPVNLTRFQEQTEALATAFEENDVNVHWLEFPKNAGGPYGAWMGHFYIAHANVPRGGSIIPKMGWLPGTIGVTEYVARWVWNELNIPVLGAITSGACEAGAAIWLAQDVLVTARSCAYSQSGIDQLVWLLSQTCGTERLHNLILQPDTDVYFDPNTGAASHPDLNLMAVDAGKVVVSPVLDSSAREWLMDNNFQLIEADEEEQRNLQAPCNVILIEGGTVIANEECPRTNRKLTDAGVNVIEVPASEVLKSGGGNRCRTMQIYREPGPTLAEIKGK